MFDLKQLMFAFWSLLLLISMSNHVLVDCKKKKKKKKPSAKPGDDPDYEVDGNGKAKGGGFKVSKRSNGEVKLPRPPTDGMAMAKSSDPQYQTLAAIGNGDVFGQDKAAGPPPGAPKPPAVGGLAQTNDPNYQTLVGINDVFQDKGAAGAPPMAPNPGGAARPQGGGIPAAQEPNYLEFGW